MMETRVGELEKRDIRAQIQKILRDLGRPEPPIDLRDVRELLSLDLQYYSSSDSGLINELTHRFTLLRQKVLPDIKGLLQSALAKSRICAFWVPDSRKILLDDEVPVNKHRWIEAHEIAHSVTPWHRAFLLGDNTQTLDPACHAMLEAEANFGAGRLLFLDDRFAYEAKEYDLSFNSIKHLAKRYRNSIRSTFWRVVEDRDPLQPVFGLISGHPHYPDMSNGIGQTAWQYLVRTPAFRTQFPGVSPALVFGLVSKHASRRKAGPVFVARDTLKDVTGDNWEFQLEAFSNGYELLTIGFPVGKHSIIVSAN